MLVAERSDAALLQGVIDGDQSAWDELTSRYERLVWSTARAR